MSVPALGPDDEHDVRVELGELPELTGPMDYPDARAGWYREWCEEILSEHGCDASNIRRLRQQGVEWTLLSGCERDMILLDAIEALR